MSASMVDLDPPPADSDTDGLLHLFCSLCRSELIDPPSHDPRANKFCGRCELAYIGSPLEYQNMQARDAARAAERGDLDRSKQGGVDNGVWDR